MGDETDPALERRTFLKATGVAGTATATSGVAGAESNEASKEAYVVGASATASMSTAEARVNEAVPQEADVTGREETLGFLTVEVPDGVSTMSSDDVIEELESQPGIEYAERDVEFRAHEVAWSRQRDGSYDPDDPRLGEQYAPQQVRAPTAWDTTLGSDDVTIAIVDQGVKYDHPDLQGRFDEVVGRDFVDGDDDPYPESLSEEYHGTHVAGIASATTDNATGVAGVSNSRLLSARALGTGGSGSLSGIASAIRWATDQGADVINMSLGGGGFTRTLKNAVSYAVNNGALPICSSGNSGREGVAYPSKYDECVSVGALDPNEDRANFSQYGEDLDVVGPGVRVLSTWTDSPYNRISGTSMSCPAVSGVAALGLAAANGDLTPTELRAKLKETARDVGLSENRGGAGCANAAALVDVVGTGNEPPTAAIEQSATTVHVGTAVEFDGTGSRDPDGQIERYDWTFGDGTTATGATATHTYESAGEYTVTLTVTDDDGATASASTSVTIEPPNEAPTVAIEQSSTTVPVDTEVAFDGSGSSDDDGQIERYEWAFGDGATATGETATHTYESAGEYDVSLTVTDDDGASNNDSVTVTVEQSNAAPTADIEQSASEVAVGTTVEFDGSGSKDSDGQIERYDWTFGDGATATGETATHAYESAGEYTVTLTVTDDAGTTANASTSVTVQASDDPCGVAKTSSADAELRGWWDSDRYVYESELDSTCQTTIAIDGPEDADFDLYVTTDGRTPSPWDADEWSVSYGSQESVIVEGDVTELGILVDAYRGSGSYTVTAEEVGGTGGDGGNPDTGTVEEGVYQIENVNSGKLVDVSRISEDPGANVHQWGDWNDPGNQQWAVEAVGDGEYRLTAQHSGLVLGLEAGATEEGTSLVQQGWRDDATQRWTFEALDDGTYALANVGSGLVADVYDAGTDDGADVVGWTSHGGDNQRWTLERVGDV